MKNEIQQLDDNDMMFGQNDNDKNTFTFSDCIESYRIDDNEGYYDIQKRMNDYLLKYLDILYFDYYIEEIDISPDYDATPYEKYKFKDYAFRTDNDFPKRINKIITISLDEFFIYNNAFLKQLEEDSNLKSKGTEADRLNYILHRKGLDIVTKHGKRTITDTITINNIVINNHCNINRKIYYSGGITANFSGLSSTEFSTYGMLCTYYIDNTIKEKPLFNELLAQSRLLIERKEYRLATFTAFSALESFINYKAHEEDGGFHINQNQNLENKSIDLFNHFGMNFNPLFEESQKGFKKYEDYRNDVTHGKGKKNYDNTTAQETLCSTLLQICAIQMKANSFEDIQK